MPKPISPFKQVRRAFDRDALKRICEMPEDDFGPAYDMEKFLIPERGEEDNFYFFKDNGADVLAVAHLDTVIAANRRTCGFLDTEAGPVVYSGALDDRLGAYTILELLPKVGIKYDWLLTVGEEKCMSTADYFRTENHHARGYNYIIEFDRGNTDVVMYEFEDDDLCDRVEEAGAKVGQGSLSDISYMQHLGVKALNWGVAYRDYHGPRGHAYLEDYWMMLGYYLRFHQVNAETVLPHVPRRYLDWWNSLDDNFTDDEYAAQGIGYIDDLDDDLDLADLVSENPTKEELDAIESLQV